MSRDVVIRETRPSGRLTLRERAVYVGGGLALAAASVKPRPNRAMTLPNLALTLLAFAAGAYLAWRGVEGTDPVKAAFNEHGPVMRAL
jgi:hypothetical protein